MNTSNANRKPRTIFINPQLYKELKILALELDKTVKLCTEEAFKEYIKNHKRKR